jgi:hypothetical protein
MERKKKGPGFATRTESRAPAERKENLQEKQSRQETVATVQKKGKELIALAAVGKGKPRTLENNLMRSNNTKSKKRNMNRMQNPFF